MAWHELEAPATEPRDGIALPCIAAGVPILLVGSDDGWWAIEDRCSHADCAFSADGDVVGHVVICNCHGSEFDVRSGAVLVAPATEPVQTYSLRSVAGRLEVEV